MIKVGFLVSYDYEYLRVSLPLVYPHANKISLAIDINRKTWAGNTFSISPDFFDWLKKIDTDHKISILEDDFYIPTLSTMENDTRERNMLGQFMGKGGWHVQLDSDEYFYDFEAFTGYLRSKDHYLQNPEKTPVTVAAYWITLFKKLDHGYLYINSYEPFRLATNNPVYTSARNTGQQTLYANFCVFHQSWARDPEAIHKKVKDWGHSNDFNTEAYLSFWDNVNEQNYTRFHNFHPLNGKSWKKLEYGPGGNVETFLQTYRQSHSLKIPLWSLLRKKIISRLGSSLKRK